MTIKFTTLRILQQGTESEENTRTRFVWIVLQKRYSKSLPLWKRMVESIWADRTYLEQLPHFAIQQRKKEKGDDDDKDDKKDDKDEKKKDKKDGVDEKLTLQEDKRVEPEFDFSKSILADFADSNGDGFISLYEFYILVLILQATDDVTKQAFLELSPVGELNKQQFQDCLTKIMKTGTTSKLTISRFLPDPRKEHLSQEKLQEVVNEMTDNLYKQREKLSFGEFLKLKGDMFKDMYTYEFYKFPGENGKISGEEFAKRIICYMTPNNTRKYLKDLDHVKFKGEVGLDEWMAFQDFLRQNYNEMSTRIESKGVMTRAQLKKMMKEYSTKEKLPISSDQLDIFIRILDRNGNGLIDKDEFIGVVQSLTFYGGGENTKTLERPFIDLEKKLENGKTKQKEFGK